MHGDVHRDPNGNNFNALQALIYRLLTTPSTRHYYMVDDYIVCM